ncbi:polysaccharide deacetylase family protein [Rubellicoccus peritrichatus]|uniref:Polysaccharide deacetylase family protein n=1 Tax=Rubellicoccus peritrichatus TaxID=3080537 RepID=A0AAQ3L8D5_9BACT|nr:polysaccharide deacetylase family protein [Puniceicoccus sp. CR14]WOO41549.1 polysaccharide deacetylase family protein [Puniceicoccus sp. CR14]
MKQASTTFAFTLMAISMIQLSQAENTPQWRGANPLDMRVYDQEFTVEYESEEMARNSKLTILPLPGGKEWAFSSRWDDNRKDNVRMRELMAKHGYRGTFYLNSEKYNTHGGRDNYGDEYARSLIEDGFSIGGHTMTHPYFDKIPMNDLWWEIMAIRVERESAIDKPISSFAFPYGIFESKTDPLLYGDVSEALFRAGYHHNVYAWYVKKEKGVEPEAVSSVALIKPGDRNTSVEQFDFWVNKYLNAPWMKNLHPNMSLGIHVWMQGDDWEAIEAGLEKYANRSDWWYCNQNEFAAYRYQFHHSELSEVAQDGKMVTYRIRRPLPADLGDMTPLSLKADGIVAVRGASVAHETFDHNEDTFILLEHDPMRGLPDAISVFDNEDNQIQDESEATVSGVHTWLQYMPAGNQLRLVLSNHGKDQVTDLHIHLRLPLCYELGNMRLDLSDIAAGGVSEKIIDLPDLVSNERYLEGLQYFVAECEFTAGDKYERVYATTRASVNSHLSQH